MNQELKELKVQLKNKHNKKRGRRSGGCEPRIEVQLKKQPNIKNREGVRDEEN